MAERKSIVERQEHGRNAMFGMRPAPFQEANASGYMEGHAGRFSQLLGSFLARLYVFRM